MSYQVFRPAAYEIHSTLIADTVAAKAPVLRPLSFFPKASDRTAWEAVPADTRDHMIHAGEAYLNFEWPWASAVSYMAYTREGNRTRYEKSYFDKRHALSALVIAEAAEHKGRFLDDIINGIYSICEESAWQLPAHNTYIRDAVGDCLHDSTAPILDLFAGETGAEMACILQVLGDDLDAVTPLICKRIRRELLTRVLIPCLNYHFWWQGDGTTKMCNWTSWIVQNVLLCMFLTDYPEYDDWKNELALVKDLPDFNAYEFTQGTFLPETKESFLQLLLEKCCRSTDYFLDEYAEDGCCDEGANYYHHAGLCLYLVLDVLNELTDHGLTDVLATDKIRNIADYIYKVHVDGDTYVNFSDASPKAGPCGVLEYRFAKLTNNDEMAQFVAADFQRTYPACILLPRSHSLPQRLFSVLMADEILHAPSDGTLLAPDTYFPGCGLFVARDQNLFFTIKGGDNNTIHNHNDVGAFAVFEKGKQLLIDLGVESYSRKTFSPERYDIWTMQSAWHNLPTIDGIMQHDGAAYRATDMKASLTKEKAEVSMNIEEAYPDKAGLSHYLRKAILTKGRSLNIVDNFVFEEGDATSHEVLLSLLTCCEPTIVSEAGTLLIRFADRTSTLMVTGAVPYEVEKVAITDARLKEAWPDYIWRIRVKAVESVVSYFISEI